MGINQRLAAVVDACLSGCVKNSISLCLTVVLLGGKSGDGSGLRFLKFPWKILHKHG